MSDAQNIQQQTTAIGELRQLKAMLEEVDASLRSQREILQRRGMNLPPMVLQSLSSMRSSIQKLETELVDEQTELAQLRSLADTSAAINSSFNVDEVLSSAMDAVIALTDAERGYIILKDPDSGKLEFRITRDMELGGQRRGDEGSGSQISQTIVNEVVESGQPLLADNAYKDERLQGNLSIANLALRSVLCVPLNYKGKTIGVVYVDNRLRSGVFTEREKSLLLAFANQAAVAIENAQLYTNIQHSLQEITAIKELMSNVFSSIGSGVITTNPDDSIVTFNRAASQILERQEDEALGKRVRSVMPLINAELDDHLAKVRQQKEPEHIDAEMEVQQRGRIALSVKLSPLQDTTNKELQGVAMVLDDLTDQREREEMLNVMKRYLPKELVDKAAELAQLDLGGERREVSCIFADVLPIAVFRNIPPQQLIVILNRTLAIATECIHGKGGVIDKYMGNEIMGLFNSQLNPMNNHAQMVVEAALEMRDRFASLTSELGIEKPVFRIGIHTGEATLGNVGSVSRRDFSAIGDTINLSHRLLENAGENQIFISEECRQHILANSKPAIRFQELSALQVKGREKPVQVYEVFKA
jgi:PAS domain S-box-containing protein